MKPCTDPRGHNWVAPPSAITTRAGSTPVECTLCGEGGYHLDQSIIDRDQGQPGEELF